MRRLLVPIDPSEYAEAATRRACEFAAKTRGTVTGFTILDTAGVGESTSLPFHAEYRDYPPPHAVALLKDAAKKLKSALERFEETCHDAGVACDQARFSGVPSEAVLELSRFYDLVVIGQRTHFHFETAEEPGDTLAEVLDNAPVPILVVPASATADPIRKALITFDGSPASTRALHAFAAVWPVSRPEVKILTCERDKETGGHLLDQAQQFLQAHDVETITTELSRDSVIDTVEEHFLDWPDLIVAGVRSQHPIQRLFVGSFARFLIEKNHRTLLFCQ